MKKTPPCKKSPTLLLLLGITFFLVILLSACEWTSLSGVWQGNGTDSVLKPDDPPTTTATTTAADEITTTAPPLITTMAASTTAPPPVTTVPAVTYFHPLTGLPCSQKIAVSRPVAFCVMSATGADLSAADIVIEAPTEGASTRLSLVGNSHTSRFSGMKIATTRPYLAALTHDLFAISVYRGTSDNGFESTGFLYDTIDLSVTEIEKTEDALTGVIYKAGYQTSVVGSIVLPYSLPALGDSILPTDMTASYVSVPFHSESSTVFTYDSVGKSYTMRSGAALTPSGSLPVFSNLMILFHDATRRVTKDGTELTLDTERGGYGYYASAGGVQQIFWKRDPITSSLVFTDKNGARLQLNRGKTYIGMTTYDLENSLVLN